MMRENGCKISGHLDNKANLICTSDKCKLENLFCLKCKHEFHQEHLEKVIEITEYAKQRMGEMNLYYEENPQRDFDINKRISSFKYLLDNTREAYEEEREQIVTMVNKYVSEIIGDKFMRELEEPYKEYNKLSEFHIQLKNYKEIPLILETQIRASNYEDILSIIKDNIPSPRAYKLFNELERNMIEIGRVSEQNREILSNFRYKLFQRLGRVMEETENKMFYSHLYKLNRIQNIHSISIISPESLTQEEMRLPPGNQIPFEFSSIQVGESIYISGGSLIDGYSSELFQYDINSHKLQTRYNMNIPRKLHGLVYIPNNHKIYALGGINNEGELSAVEKYNTNTYLWESSNALNVPKSAMSLCILGGTWIYTFGGFGDGKYLSVIERLNTFDLGSEMLFEEGGTWEIVNFSNREQSWVKANLFSIFSNSTTGEYGGVSEAAAIMLTHTQILIFGGENDNGLTSNSFKFNVDTSEFEPFPSLNLGDKFIGSMPIILNQVLYALGKNYLHAYSFVNKKWAATDANHIFPPL